MAPQSTLNVVSDYISDARTLLQDVVAPYRYDDPSLLVALNVTLLEASRIRPDLFVFTNSGLVQSFTVNDRTQLFMEPPFRLGILHGLCGHAMLRDQEDYQDVRATAFMGIFNDILLGVRIQGIVGGSGPGKP